LKDLTLKFFNNKVNRSFFRAAVFFAFIYSASSIASVGYVGIISSQGNSSADWSFKTSEEIYSFALNDLMVPRSDLLISTSATLFDLELVVDGITEAKNRLSLFYISTPIISAGGCSFVLQDGSITFDALFNMLENRESPTILFIDVVSGSQIYRCKQSIERSISSNVYAFISSSRDQDVIRLSNSLGLQEQPQISDLGLSILLSFFHESIEQTNNTSADTEYFGPEISYLEKYHAVVGSAFDGNKIKSSDIKNSLIYLKYSKLITQMLNERKLALEQEARDIAVQKATLAKQARESAAREKAAREKAAREKAAREKAAREKAAREKAAREKAAREKAEQERAARERAARERAARERAARERAIREEAARKKAEEEAARKKAEEEAARKKAEEEARKKKNKPSFAF
jgi:hypothetical protein